MKIPSWKIDWPNHVIGFFSALFGILIAFEMDEWRQSRGQEELAANAFERIRQEIEINQAALHETTSFNLQLIRLLSEDVLPKLNDNILFTGSMEKALAINSHPQLSQFIMINLPEGATGKDILRSPVQAHVLFGALVLPPIHTSAWESAKTIGALNNMSYQKVQTLSSLYNPTRIDDELNEVRLLLRNADDVQTRRDLIFLLSELQDAYRIIASELQGYDAFVSMLGEMD